MALRALKSGLLPADQRPDPPSLAVKVWGRTLPNPIGLAAGFDKNAEVPDALLGLGFGLVEIGSVTPRPQDGNPRPRLFRLPEDRGVINRMGFPGQGLDAARSRLAVRPRRGFVGVNVGANKDSTDRAADYVACSVALAPYADYLVCNVSSPNTPGLRNLQGRTQLADLLKRVQDAIAARPVPLLVKIAPDATDDDLDDIVAVCRELRHGRHHRRQHHAVRGPRRCARPDATRPAVFRARRSRRSPRKCCAAPRGGSKASSPWSAAAASARAPMPMPRSAPARPWCSSTRRWSTKVRRSSAASRTSWRCCWRAMALQQWPMR